MRCVIFTSIAKQLSSARASRLLVALSLLLLFHTTSALAKQVTFAWDANKEPILGGYCLHYGQTSRNYTSVIDVGNQTTFTVFGLADDKKYYFAVTAYNTTKTIKSGFSNEVVVTPTLNPLLRINDASRAEGHVGTTAFTFTVTLSPASPGTVTVKYATASGTATAGSDYTAIPVRLLTFAPGQTRQTVTVNGRGNTTVEPNETFAVNLSAASGATIFEGQGVGTILNDDGPVLRISDVGQAEGHAGDDRLDLHGDAVPGQYQAGDGEVRHGQRERDVAGSDYTATGGTLTFAPGQTRQTVTVNGRGNTTVEPNETFAVNLSAASGATIFDSQGVGTILNDDGPVLRISDVSQAEGHAGATAFPFTVTLSPASTGPVTVRYATANGSALAGSDYTATGGTLTFAPGQTRQTVTVNGRGDTTVEPNETFAVNLSAASGATLFDWQGVGTILNDDGPVLRISDASRAEGHAGDDRLHLHGDAVPGQHQAR